uniref:NADH dehydrogenase [ubiquinone] iron-sulfur protein 4, mitochondrial n=1 Tax=Parascaris univalens TaxID=6257 RepID=A0A915BG68_PARUN
MLGIRSYVSPLRSMARGLATVDKSVPVTRLHDAKRKSLEEVLQPTPAKTNVTVVGEYDEVMDIAGVPEEHMEPRTARIFKPAREATQSGWNNTKAWKIELDNRERWENPLMGWASTGDPLSNISMNMDFASKEDAINFCVKNRWSYEVDEPHERHIKPKAYGSNFSWKARTRVSTK